MDFSYISLDSVQVTRPTEKEMLASRTWQGIPGIQKMPSGRLFAIWYAGGNGEGRDNYAQMVISDDDGMTWSDAVAVVNPPAQVRAFDPVIWLAPDGRLFWFWAQGCGGEANSGDVFDGIAGVWCSILENPDDAPEAFRFTPSRRIANGIMMNKPTVLKDGTWALPCSIWSGEKYIKHDSLGVVPGAYFVVSTDNGQTFSVRGRIDSSLVEGGPEYDEHIFIETTSGLLRCYMRVRKGLAESVSYDGGRTWSKPELSSIKAPSSRIFIGRLMSGALLLVKNDSETIREKLTAYLSFDDGKSWSNGLLLKAEAHVSYPDSCQGDDGTIYIVYDKDRFHGGYFYMSKITEQDILQGKPCSPGSVLNIEISHSKPVPNL